MQPMPMAPSADGNRPRQKRAITNATCPHTHRPHTPTAVSALHTHRRHGSTRLTVVKLSTRRPNTTRTTHTPPTADIAHDSTQRIGGFRYDNSDSVSPLEKKKAPQDTASWCLERCIKLGHCEVFEDLNKMSTAQVQDFCKACVLTGEATQDECDVSMMFIEDGPWASIDRAAVGV